MGFPRTSPEDYDGITACQDYYKTFTDESVDDKQKEELKNILISL